MWEDIGILNGTGNIKSDIHSLLKFAKAQMTPESSVLADAIKTSQETLADFGRMSIGYGWLKVQQDGHTVFDHVGDTSGFVSKVTFAPSMKKAMIILSNYRIDLKCPARLFFLGKDDCNPISFGTKDAQDLQDYVGTYDLKDFAAEFKIGVNDRGFIYYKAVTKIDLPQRLIYKQKDSFITAEGVSLKFERNDKGRVIAATQFFQGKEYRAAKKI